MGGHPNEGVQGRVTSDEAMPSPSQGGSRGSQQATQPPVGEAYVNKVAQAMDFLGADLSTKLAMVERPTKSWDLAPLTLHSRLG